MLSESKVFLIFKKKKSQVYRRVTPSQSILMLETISISLNFWLRINPVGSYYCIVMASSNSWMQAFIVLWCEVLSWSVPSENAQQI